MSPRITAPVLPASDDSAKSQIMDQGMPSDGLAGRLPRQRVSQGRFTRLTVGGLACGPDCFSEANLRFLMLFLTWEAR
jgi:hypothetical protein